MNRRIENWIPKAIIAAEQHLANNGVIKSEYNGYVSSFGAAILQSGLKAAVAFNERPDSSSNEDRKPLMKAILQIITGEEVGSNSNRRLLNYLLHNDNTETKQQIIDAAVALKLAIRTFKLKKGE